MGDSSGVSTDCLGPWAPIKKEVYAGSGWIALQGQELIDGDGQRKDHYVVQAVVAFPTADTAQAFFADSVQAWSDCSSRRVTYSKPGRPKQSWSYGEVSNHDDTLTMLQVQEGAAGRACQRALAVTSNVVIDTRSAAST